MAQRGRPRKEITTNGGKTDKRKTQVREAQRAYRRRKEDAFHELEGRLATLTKLVQRYDDSFRQYLHFTKDETLTAAHRSQLDIVEQAHSKLSSRAVEACPTPCSLLTSGRNSDDSGNSNAWLAVCPETIVDPFTVTDNGTDKGDLWHRTVTAQNIMNFQVQQPGLNQELTLPASCSYQESTFGRRLHRAMAEVGYELLLHPEKRNRMYRNAFRLPISCQVTMKHIASRFSAIIGSTIFDELTVPGRLGLHIGGAGTHYAKMDQYGIWQDRTKVPRSAAMFGTSLLTLAWEDAVAGVRRSPISIQLEGFEGDWLDPYDIEGYLLEKGFLFHGGVDFVDCELTRETQTSSESSSVSSPTEKQFNSSKDAFSRTPPYTEEQLHMLREADVDTHLLEAGFIVNAVGHSDTRTPFNRCSGNAPSSDPGLIRRGVLDVEKLVKNLVALSSCLIQCPGMPKLEIDRALSLAVCAY